MGNGERKFDGGVVLGKAYVDRKQRATTNISTFSIGVSCDHTIDHQDLTQNSNTDMLSKQTQGSVTYNQIVTFLLIEPS